MESEKHIQLVCPNCKQLNEQSIDFCSNCGYKFIKESQKLLDVSQTLKSAQTFGICCVLWASMLLIMFTAFSFIEWGVGGILVLLITAGAIFFLVVFLLSLTPHASKVRSFIVTQDKIEISTPNKPFFQINWAEFDTIDIKRRTTGYRQYKRVFYTFNFLGKETQSIVLESNTDFKKIHKEIIPTLKELALSKGKEFSGYGK